MESTETEKKSSQSQEKNFNRPLENWRTIVQHHFKYFAIWKQNSIKKMRDGSRLLYRTKTSNLDDNKTF